MIHLRSALPIALVGAASAVGCAEGAQADGTPTSVASTGAASTVAPTSTAAAPAGPAVTPLPTEPAPTTVQIDLAAMQWKDLKTGKSLELVDTDLGKCGLPGWHLPLPKGSLLVPLVTSQGQGCGAKNIPGPPGTELMVVIEGGPLGIHDIEKAKAIAFEAPDGYILEHETRGTPPFYPRVEREIAGVFTSCSLTYVDFDTARAAYALCRKLQKGP